MATVEVDDELLKKARKITGERTYSATIQKALEDVVQRQERMIKALEATWNLGDEIFWPGWLEEQGFKKPEPKRVSAAEKRIATTKRRKQVKRRAPR